MRGSLSTLLSALGGAGRETPRTGGGRRRRSVVFGPPEISRNAHLSSLRACLKGQRQRNKLTYGDNSGQEVMIFLCCWRDGAEENHAGKALVVGGAVPNRGHGAAGGRALSVDLVLDHSLCVVSFCASRALRQSLRGRFEALRLGPSGVARDINRVWTPNAGSSLLSPNALHLPRRSTTPRHSPCRHTPLDLSLPPSTPESHAGGALVGRRRCRTETAP